VLIFSGLRASTAIDANAFALLPGAIGAYSDGIPGVGVYRSTANRQFSTAPVGANLDLRSATPATDPDLSYAAAYTNP
jgi:hypothetical protein